jgi:hypothetical protein
MHRGSLPSIWILLIVRAALITNFDFHVQLMVKKWQVFNIFFEFMPVPLEQSGIQQIFFFRVSLEPV